MDQIKIVGYATLFIGIALLLFTFVLAYQLLMGVEPIPITGDFGSIFGGAFSPLITSAMKVLYLGVMGWVGSILTRRGVQVIVSQPKETKAGEEK
ncbi:MAG: hypothetical protein RMJ07_02595 [Nitrososphaerota archaeon]|nr:hypothetical protein [Nitrososphaerota archaeon]